MCHKEMQTIDKKIENLIGAIRKNIENPDAIIAKVEIIAKQKEEIL